MNKKTLALLAAIAFGIGAISTVAYQSHAQQAVTLAPAVTSSVTVPKGDATSTTDTDNIQNDQGGVDKPDAVETGTDLETNDDSATSTLSHADANESAEAKTSDATEVEAGN